MIQRHFDAVLGPEELVEGAVPGIELTGMDADPAALVPMGDEPSAHSVADEVGLEPAGQAMFTGRGDEPVGDQREGAVGEGDALGSPEVLVEDRPEAELVEEGADDEDRPPVGGITDAGCGRIAGLEVGIAGEEAAELGEDLDEEVLAAEVGDDPLLDLAVMAIGFDDADVFVDGAAGGADFDGSWVHDGLPSSEGVTGVHGNYCHDRLRRNQG